MKGLSKIILISLHGLFIAGCAANSSNQQYVEPVQQVDNFNYDYDYPLEVEVKWYLQEADKSNYTGENNWYFGRYVMLPEDKCYKIVNKTDADTIYIRSQVIWKTGKFGEDRGESDRVEEREGDYEQGREDREADQER